MPPPAWDHTVFFNIDPRLFEQSGNFDFPPASGNNGSSTSPPAPTSSTSQNHYSSVAARFRNLRELLNSERERARRIRDADRQDTHNLIESQGDDVLRERNRQRLRNLEILDIEEGNLRRDEQRRRTNVLERATRPPPTSASTHGGRDSQPYVVHPSLSASIPPRARANPGRRYLQRQRQRQDQRHSSSLTGLQEAGARLAEASSSLSALLDEPMPRLASPDMYDFVGDGDGNRWRAKRRKLETDNSSGDFNGFTYGHYGQVVSGPLKMEIYHCDGGAYSEPFGDMSDVENVLVDDPSVYCTKTDVCNIILQHQGQTPFDLRKLVIRSPQHDFDAPIQEGMIFVSMSSEDLLTRTAQYQIRYTSNSRPGDPNDRRPANSRHRGYPQTVSADPISHYPRPLRSIARNPATNRHDSPESESEDEIPDFIPDPNNAELDRHPTPAPDATLFRVTTDFDDKSEVEDDDQHHIENFLAPVDPTQNSRASWLSPYPQRDSDTSDSEEDDEASDENNPAGEVDQHGVFRRRLLQRTPRLHGDLHPLVARRRNQPSLIEPTGPASHNGTQTNGPGAARSRPDVMVPHARFFIERHKSMVKLKFDPPVSGRFVLIKLWSPYSGGNIDIQSTIAHGFAGPRFFPAVEMR